MHPLVTLIRRYCEEYVNRHDFTVLQDIMSPGYQLHVGGFHLTSRDEDYIPTMTKAFKEYPEFAITVHDLFTDGSSAAVRFSLHSSAASRDGGRAVWSGVVIYGWDGSQLTEAWAEEDFFSRKMQLRSENPQPLEPPHPDPWNTTALPADAAAEKVLRSWLSAGSLDDDCVVLDDLHATGFANGVSMDIDEVTINTAFAVAGQGAFHIAQRGTYRGGLPGLESRIGSPVVRHAAGIAQIDDDSVRQVRAFTDRLEMSRRLDRR